MEREVVATGRLPRAPSPVLPVAIAALVAAAAMAAIFWDGLVFMVGQWSKEEYSYAYLVPVLAAAMIGARLPELARAGARPAWSGVALVLLGVAAAVFGELSTIYTVIHYAFLLTLFGLAWTLVGGRGVRVILAPLVYLAFIVPLPEFLYQGLSARLQLVSSELGVAFIGLFGISVFLEGNVIDLGVYQLQVVEACSGLRYLFPLASFGFLFAYLYNGPLWHKVLLFLSVAPVTIAINSLRIGVIGVLVEHTGIEAAEGFLHFFEGWVIFLAGVGLLFLLMAGLARVGGPGGGLRELIRLELLIPRRMPEGALLAALPRPFALAAALLAVSAIAILALPERAEVVPERPRFAAFPLALGDWQGRAQPLEQVYVDALRFDDYVLADYARPGDAAPVNLYAAYYASQRKGASVHSPRSCIPGGGWEIAELRTASVDGAGPGGAALAVNRTVIARGTDRQLVYYWFQQRGRRMTNEYVVKWMIFWDALGRSRTDGALVRLVTPVAAGENLARAEARLQDFLRAAAGRLDAFIPD